ncbi:hypothetical protein BMF94_6931 [Rhodotorula taiwanensis]|uniref:Uncharacterized protein n=1 Tax=Rhodotorula taiwanensis TaxID=741276 RepID=A0A2S5AZW7_9BASI|nr:hypothetical protein BMF94_6931 [Rhodotorula taiwanensis]
MSGLDPTEAQLAAVSLGIEEGTAAEKAKQDSYVVDEKRADSYASDEEDDNNGGLGPTPTAEEKLVLPRVPGPINLAAFLIGFIELAERFSYYGCTIVFTNFIQQPLPEGSTTGSAKSGQPGALGMGQQASTGLTTFNQFWSYTMPMFGAYIADTYLGRYNTVCWAVLVAMVGHVLLIISAIPTVISKPNVAIGVFAVAIVIMGVGTGMFKANISPMIAEQVTNHAMYVKTDKKGRRVIVDPAVTSQRVYMAFYLLINCGALAGQLGMVYAEKNIGFYMSFLLPTVVFALTPPILYFGRNRYIRTRPAGSILGKCLNVLRFAVKQAGPNPASWVRAGFWEKALPSRYTEADRPSYMTWNDQWVWEVRKAFKACQVFIFLPLYWLTYNQINNNLTSQAAVLNTHGLPNDILANLNPFALLILLPSLELVIYPALRRAGIRFTPVKRIFCGFMVGALAMVCATLVQNEIYKKSACGKNAATCEEMPFIDLNVWVQAPSYVLIALSEIFASVTTLEYAFTKAPKSMRSMVMSIQLFMTAISSALGFAFLSLSEDPNLVINYALMAGLAFAGGVLFAFCFRRLDKEEDQLNELVAGDAHQTDKVRAPAAA